MKNWIGLLIALSLGIVACLLNWKYLDRKNQEVEVISFLAIKEGAGLKTGKKFEEADFEKLDIPRKNAGTLQETAVLFRDRHAVVSLKALHDYHGGEIVLRQELRTPPVEFKLKDKQLAMWIPVNSATFVPSLVKPGDEVSFVVPNPTSLFSDIEEPNPNEQPQGPEFGDDENFDKPVENRQMGGATELVGPFTVLSLGDRLGSYEVSVASGGNRSRENVMGIIVNEFRDGLDPKAEKLVRWMAQPNFRQASVVLHPRKENK